MTEPVLHVSASPQQTQAIATVVSDLIDGKGIDCGDGTRLGVSLPFDFTAERVGSERKVRITIRKDVAIVRPGVDPWLDYLDVFADGRVYARVRAFGISLDKRVQ